MSQPIDTISLNALTAAAEALRQSIQMQTVELQRIESTINQLRGSSVVDTFLSEADDFLIGRVCH